MAKFKKADFRPASEWIDKLPDECRRRIEIGASDVIQQWAQLETTENLETAYRWALVEIAPYFDCQPEPDSPAGRRFNALALIIEAYEDKLFICTS